MIHLEKNPCDKEKLAALFKKAQSEGIDSTAVEEAISLLTKSGAVAEARLRGQDIIAKNSKALASFFSSAETDASRLITELFDSLRG